MAPGWDKSSSGIGYTGIIKLQQTLLDKILSMYIRLFCNYSLRASTFSVNPKTTSTHEGRAERVVEV